MISLQRTKQLVDDDKQKQEKLTFAELYKFMEQQEGGYQTRVVHARRERRVSK